MCVSFLCEGVVDVIGLWWPFWGGAQLLQSWCLVGVGFWVFVLWMRVGVERRAFTESCLCLFLMVRMVMVMVMQVASRKRVDRHHPELLGQPVGANPHVRTVSVRRRR